MSHKSLFLSLLSVVLCLNLMTGCSTSPAPVSTPPAAPPATADHNGDAKAPTTQITTGSLQLDPFSNIDLSVMSADIQIQTGDAYAIAYQLHGKESVEQAEVVDGTLHFSTGIDPANISGHGHWSVVVTIPADASLNQLHLSTLAGNIAFSGLRFAEGTLESQSGEILLHNLTCDKLKASTLSEDITITDSQIGQLTADSKSDDINVTGTFDTVDLYSISGDCELGGTVTTRAELETVSGDIELVAQTGTINAQTHGEIEHNDHPFHNELTTGNGDPVYQLKSVSGDIEIESY